MLKELFILQNGATMLHYSSDSDLEDRDEAVLASGFLSAISSFSEEARSSSIDTFTSENELFYFTKLNSDVEVVGVFEKQTNDDIARLLMRNLRIELLKKDFIYEDSVQVNAPEKEKFKNQISEITTSILDTEEQERHLDQVIDNNDGVIMALVANKQDKDLIWKYANPSTLYEKKVLDELFLFHSILTNTISKLDLGTDLVQTVLASNRYATSIFKNGDYLFAGTAPVKDSIAEITARLAHLEPATELFQDEKKVTSLINFQMDEQGNIEDLPQDAPPTTSVLIQTLLNNATNYFNVVTKRREVKNISIITQDKNLRLYKLEIEKIENNGYDITVYE